MLERYRGIDPEKPIIEIEADGDDWVMESIIASGPSDDNPKGHVFLVKWKDFSQEENTWEAYDNVADNDPRLFKEYKKKNPKVEQDGRFKGNNKKGKDIGKRNRK